MKKEYPIDDHWVSYELHPETPPQGMLLSRRFKAQDLSSFIEQLRARGKDAGVAFGDLSILSNSKLALMASEFSRDMGFYDTFHEKIFHAYFTEGKDIGNPDVIASLAAESHLDAGEMLKTVNDGRYAARLEDAGREGRLIGLTGVPLFIINNQYKIIGAQPIEIFRNILDKK